MGLGGCIGTMKMDFRLTSSRLANKVLQGFFVAPIESLIEISITDLVGTMAERLWLIAVLCT